MFYMKVALLFLFGICFCDSANILGVFHFPSKSHHILGSALLKELAKRGHNVTMLSPFPLKSPLPNYTDIVISGHYEQKEDILRNLSGEEENIVQKIWTIMSSLNYITSDILNEDAIQKFIKTDSEFDLVILFYLMGEPFLGLADHFKAPVIAFHPVGSTPMLNYHSGNISPYSFVPLAFLSYSETMTFRQRLKNTVFSTLMNLFTKFVIFPRQEKMVRLAFPKAPPLEELLEKVNLYLINTHYSNEGVRPYLTNMKQIGGFHLQEKEEMEDELREFIESSKEGVIYFSLGSNFRSSDLSMEKLEIIKAVFQKLPVKVLWKFEKQIPGLPENVKIASWFPQRAVLAHSNVKLFITHGGYGSITEGTFFGVPMIGIPIFGDQLKNVADLISKGYGVDINFHSFNEEDMYTAINEVLKNPKYMENVQIASQLMQDEPINPMDHAVFWVEHVLKYKSTDHFKTVASKLPFYQYLLIDVIAFIGFVIFCSIISLYVIVKILLMARHKLKKVKTS